MPEDVPSVKKALVAALEKAIAANKVPDSAYGEKESSVEIDGFNVAGRKPAASVKAED
jgi:hypothetical protein